MTRAFDPGADIPGGWVAEVGSRLSADQAADVTLRAALHLPAVRHALGVVFPGKVDAVLDAALEVVMEAAAARRPSLRRLDRDREIEPDWFLREHQVGYVAYADRFAGDLPGVLKRLGHLRDLGVTYLHLMPLLRARPGESDGGYAVEDYEQVDPALGTMADLETLAEAMHDEGMALCIDLVVNHTADTHAWVKAALAGDERYRRFYRVFPDRTEPDRYETTLREVFPEFAPGNFTEVEGLGWVWTTFNSYQWDLDHSNPDVFVAMLEVICGLANRGADVIRLDAAPFLWKELGTDCENRPGAHALLQAWRSLVRIAAPATLFKAEAIVAPNQLVQYLGAHDREFDETDIAYHNQLMVQLWSSLAAQDTRLARRSLEGLRPAPPTTTWVTYVRNHDDIGWAIDDGDAAAVGWNGYAHRSFLVSYFNGTFPGSPARGQDFQRNEATGDARTSGTTAALVGLDAARQAGDEVAISAAIERFVLIHSVIYSFGGIPLLYMGDEVALANDDHYADDPAHAADNRWLHRPQMDWECVDRRSDPASVEGRVFSALEHLGAVRSRTAALRGGGDTWIIDAGDDAVLAYGRRHRRSSVFVALVNVSDRECLVRAAVLTDEGLSERDQVFASGGALDRAGDALHLAPRCVAWFVRPD